MRDTLTQQTSKPKYSQRSKTPKELPGRKGQNVETMKNTLAALKEEKSTLEEKLKINKADTDTQFELELVTKNIATLMDKILKA